MEVNRPVVYEEKLVAFIDILGFKNLIQQNAEKSVKSINFLDEHLRHVIKCINELNEKGFFSTKMFSDCICLSCEFSTYGMERILYELSNLQLHFSFGGLFFRGALSFGHHYENDLIIFSKGLVKAYELEKRALYPRIIIDNQLAEIMLKEFAIDNKVDYVMKGPDGTYFLDYLDLLYESALDQAESLSIHKQSIIEQLGHNLSDNNIIEKYRWLAEYHNVKFNEFFVPDEWDEEYYKTELYGQIFIQMDKVFPTFNKIIGSQSPDIA